MNCIDCKYVSEDYIWDGEDEYPTFYCSKMKHITSEDYVCEHYKKQKTHNVEKDTECDRCEFLNECSTIEVTSMTDTRRHFIGERNNCKHGK